MIEFRPVVFILGILLCVLAVAMAIPAVVDALVGHPDWQVFAASAATTLFAGVSMILTARVDLTSFSLRQAFIMTNLAWLVMAAFGALPFAYAELELSITDAFFESMSGITTTGATVIVGLDHAPPGILLWRAILQRTFEEVDGYDEMVLLRDIRFESHCEHHIKPIIGRVHIAYLPDHRVVGISKLARLVDAYAKRLQIQEKMTAQIANTIEDVLQPQGVAVVIEATHQCMTTRGVYKPGATMVTSRMLGRFRSDHRTRREFLSLIRSQNGQPDQA